MQVHAIDVPVAVSIELRKVQGLVKLIERFDEQQVDVVLIVAALVFRLIVHSGSGDVERAVTCALIVGVQAFIRERGRAAAVDERIERLKRIVVGKGMVRERHAQRQHVSDADRGHTAFPSRRNRGAQREHIRALPEHGRLPGKGLLRQVSRQLRMAEALGNLRTLVERAIRTVAFDLLLGGDARRTLVAGTGSINGKRRSRPGRERQGQDDDRDRAGSDGLHLMREGINDRRLIAHAVPFAWEGPVINLPVHALRSLRAKQGRKRVRPEQGTEVCSCGRRLLFTQLRWRVNTPPSPVHPVCKESGCRKTQQPLFGKTTSNRTIQPWEAPVKPTARKTPWSMGVRTGPLPPLSGRRLPIPHCAPHR